MGQKPSNVNTSQHPLGRLQGFPRQPRSLPGTQGSTHGRAQVAVDPVRDRIDSDWAPAIIYPVRSCRSCPFVFKDKARAWQALSLMGLRELPC